MLDERHVGVELVVAEGRRLEAIDRWDPPTLQEAQGILGARVDEAAIEDEIDLREASLAQVEPDLAIEDPLDGDVAPRRRRQNGLFFRPQMRDEDREFHRWPPGIVVRM